MNTSKKRALILYYTCSNNTARLAREAEAVIRKAGWQVELTSLRNAENTISPAEVDFLVLGTPVQYFTVPEAAFRMVRNLPDMSGACAFVFSAYGGCVTNNVPYVLADVLSKKGATIVGGAQFLTPHSCRINGNESLGNTEAAFGKGRPDDRDLEDFRDVLTQLVGTIDGGTIVPVDLDRLKMNTMGFLSAFMETFSTLKLKRAFMPRVEINTDVCTGCKTCAMVCDPGSIGYDADDTVFIDRDTCTKCYACIEQCAEGALTTNWKQAEFLVRAMNKIAKHTTTTIVP